MSYAPVPMTSLLVVVILGLITVGTFGSDECTFTGMANQYKVRLGYDPDNHLAQFIVENEMTLPVWTGVGFSRDKRMVYTDVLLIYKHNDQYNLADGWIQSKGRAPVLNRHHQTRITRFEARNEVGVFYLTRPISFADSHYDYALSECLFYVFPEIGGTYNQDSGSAFVNFEKHLLVPRITEQPICIVNCPKLRGFDDRSELHRAARRKPNELPSPPPPPPPSPQQIEPRIARPPSAAAISEEDKQLQQGSQLSPDGCSYIGQNGYKAYWYSDIYQSQAWFLVEADISNSKWTGIGFSRDRRMSNTDVLMMWVYNGYGQLYDAWLSGYSPPTFDQIPRGLFLDRFEQVNDRIGRFYFRRVIDQVNNNNDIDLNDCNLYFVFPEFGGSVSAQGRFLQHERTPTVLGPVCLTNCGNRNFWFATTPLPPPAASPSFSTTTPASRAIPTAPPAAALVADPLVPSAATETDGTLSSRRNSKLKCSYSGRNGYSAVWYFDPRSFEIRFRVTANLYGGKWSGIGFSRDSRMIGSDIILFWVRNSMPVLLDGYLMNKTSSPQADWTPQQERDTTLVYSQYSSVVQATFYFSRKLLSTVPAGKEAGDGNNTAEQL